GHGGAPAQTLEIGPTVGPDAREVHPDEVGPGAAHLREGTLLGGRYRIDRVLGQGGMGIVYRAEQTDLARAVAIKVLYGALSRDVEALARFEREARLAASMGHENIVAVHDVGKTADDVPYIVMDLLEGTSLAELLRGADPVPFPRLLDILDQVLAALETAHQKGVVHRDIKPENIFVIPGEERDRVKVLDFGISKVTGADGQSVQLTRTGALLGTPQYMSPEQATGDGQVDQRTDLHAVGVILFHALSGTFPYRCDNLYMMVASLVRDQP